MTRDGTRAQDRQEKHDDVSRHKGGGNFLLLGRGDGHRRVVVGSRGAVVVARTAGAEESGGGWETSGSKSRVGECGRGDRKKARRRRLPTPSQRPTRETQVHWLPVCRPVTDEIRCAGKEKRFERESTRPKRFRRRVPSANFSAKLATGSEGFSPNRYSWVSLG